MIWKRSIALIVILAALSGDALAWGAVSLCDGMGDPSLTESSCCCGPDACPAAGGGETGLVAACCDMREPASSPAEGAPAPREAGFAPLLTQSPAASAVVPVLAPDGTGSLGRPDEIPSHHSPPLYTLFRSYRN